MPEIRYCEGQLLLYKAPPSKFKIERPKNGFYIMLERRFIDGSDNILLCPINKKNELIIENNVYKTVVIYGRSRHITPSVINFRHKIIPSLIPK